MAEQAAVSRGKQQSFACRQSECRGEVPGGRSVRGRAACDGCGSWDTWGGEVQALRLKERK